MSLDLLKTAAKHPVTYIMIALVSGISVVFTKYTDKSDSNDDYCRERINKLETMLDAYTNTILLQRGELTNRNMIIDSLKNKSNVE